MINMQTPSQNKNRSSKLGIRTPNSQNLSLRSSWWILIPLAIQIRFLSLHYVECTPPPGSHGITCVRTPFFRPQPSPSSDGDFLPRRFVELVPAARLLAPEAYDCAAGKLFIVKSVGNFGLLGFGGAAACHSTLIELFLDNLTPLYQSSKATSAGPSFTLTT